MGRDVAALKASGMPKQLAKPPQAVPAPRVQEIAGKYEFVETEWNTKPRRSLDSPQRRRRINAVRRPALKFRHSDEKLEHAAILGNLRDLSGVNGGGDTPC
jgi:hypothetical protein